MAMPDYTAPFERDLRSADRGFKRDRDLAAKWAHGVRPMHGAKNPGLPMEQTPDLGGDSFGNLIRPQKKWSEWSRTTKKNHNVNKPESNCDLPAGRMRNAANAKQEVQDASRSHSLVYFLPSTQRNSLLPEVSKSYENNQNPTGMPLPLSLFVKTTGRETERLVEKEYEILDGNGQLLKGRRARFNLRHGNSHNSQQDDGFELL